MSQLPITRIDYCNRSWTTSTPIREDQVVKGMEDGHNNGGKGDEQGGREAKRISISSDFTQVSTTDISNHGDILENNRTVNHVMEPHKILIPSDIMVELDVPPPVPSTPPPSLDSTEEISR